MSGNNTDKIYYLMNKNRLVAEFGLGSNDIVAWGKLPYGFLNISHWISDRAKFSCAKNVEEFFRSIGILDISSFIEVTHCVSLTDTFWVRRAEDNISWDRVSPFRNNYSNVISTYALEGINIGNDGKNYFSPVISTDGSFPHTWKFNNGDVLFIKAGSKYTLGGSNSGREPFSEYYSSKVADYLGFSHVDYKIRNHKRHDNRVDCVTECKCYTSEKYGSVPAYKLGLDSYEKVLDFCKKLSNDSLVTMLNMLFLDCLLLNTDRHFSNIEFMFNNDTLEIVGITPIFDNNYALLPRFIEGYDEFKREEYRVRDGRTFEELYELINSYKSYNKLLIKLKNFKFEKPSRVDISDGRLKFLNDFLQMQVDYLLSI